jgi:hypothetical protein
MFTHISMRNQNARKARVPNGKQRWGQSEAEEYYGNEDVDDFEDSEEEEKRMPDWKVGLTRLQRKLHGEERERDKMPIGIGRVSSKSKAFGESDDDDDAYEDEDELEGMSDYDD